MRVIKHSVVVHATFAEIFSRGSCRKTRPAVIAHPPDTPAREPDGAPKRAGTGCDYATAFASSERDVTANGNVATPVLSRNPTRQVRQPNPTRHRVFGHKKLSINIQLTRFEHRASLKESCRFNGFSGIVGKYRRKRLKLLTVI